MEKKMKDKIFIELIVPDIEEIYNIYIPINKRIGNIIKLLNSENKKCHSASIKYKICFYKY